MRTILGLKKGSQIGPPPPALRYKAIYLENFRRHTRELKSLRVCAKLEGTDASQRGLAA